MKILKKLWLLPVALMVAGTFGACCDYEEESLGGNVPEPEKQPVSVVGSWLEDNSDPVMGKILMSESVYKEDGTFWANVKIISAAEGLNLNMINEGTYTYENGKLTESYFSSLTGGKINDVYKVLLLDKYTLKTEYASSVAVLNKIVETHNVEVGADVVFAYSDADFNPVSFATSDERVATVDESGKIKAVKRGVAYITAYASVGNAVAKIVVEDPDNYVDDFIEDVSAPIESVIAKYGPNYLELNNGTSTLYEYYFADDLMSRAFFEVMNGAVNNIDIEISPNADFNKIYEMFGNKYEQTYEEETFKIYSYSTDEISVSILVSEETRSVFYQWNKKSYETFDEVFYMSIDEAAATLGLEVSEEDDEKGVKRIYSNGNDEYIEHVSIYYDATTRKIAGMMIIINPGFTEEEVEGWYKDKYYPTGMSDIDFCNSEAVIQASLFINVTCDENDGQVMVSYISVNK